ncbi:hypothetical protein BR93DRAFT_962786 [Coniochaeta sp. PMI_546]|nr:hypothetical protein BR93DRAFT_962786 [Coniochaeta sp. PMI_546]
MRLNTFALIGLIHTSLVAASCADVCALGFTTQVSLAGAFCDLFTLGLYVGALPLFASNCNTDVSISSACGCLSAATSTVSATTFSTVTVVSATITNTLTASTTLVSTASSITSTTTTTTATETLTTSTTTTSSFFTSETKTFSTSTTKTESTTTTTSSISTALATITNFQTSSATITNTQTSSTTITNVQTSSATITNVQTSSATITNTQTSSTTITNVQTSSATITNTQTSSDTIVNTQTSSTTITGTSTATAATTAVCNYVKNYGFEATGNTGTPIPDWTLTTGAGGAIVVVGTENNISPVQGARQVRVTGGTSASRNRFAQVVTLCPGTSSLSLTAWAVGTTANDCTVKLCLGSTCTTNIFLSANYAAYGAAGPVSGSSVSITIDIFCATASTKAYLDFVTVG